MKYLIKDISVKLLPLLPFIREAVSSGSSVVFLPQVIPRNGSKSVKNQAELDGMHASTAFLCWLENALKSTDAMITEYDVAVKIEEFRGQAKVNQNI
jgi:hypothetical protein